MWWQPPPQVLLLAGKPPGAEAADRSWNRAGLAMTLGDEVRTAVALPGIPIGTTGRVKEVGRLFVVVGFRDGRIGYYTQRQLELVPQSGGDAPYVPLGFDGEQVRYGSHLCLLPSTSRELIEAVARYTAAGLAAGEDCAGVLPRAWIVRIHEALTEMGAEAEAAEAEGRLTLMPIDNLYLAPGDFTAEKQLARTKAALDSLGQGNGARARLFGFGGPDLFCLPEWWEYEAGVTSIIEASEVVALCAYEPGGWQSDQWSRARAVHPYIVRKGEVLPGEGRAHSADLPGEAFAD